MTKTRTHKSDALAAIYETAAGMHEVGVAKGLVSQWERGEKRPRGGALKLLNLIRRHGLNALA